MVPLTIVTSAYELRFEEARGGSPYKSFVLLVETLDALIANENFKFIIYTDQYTNDKYNLQQKYNRSNVTVVLKELNSEMYQTILNPIREHRFANGDIYERMYAVKNYVEVIINKLDNLLESSQENEYVLWLDAGLFGTSCSNEWRGCIKEIVYNKNILLEKLATKIEQHNFICLRGHQITINYEMRDRLVNFHSVPNPVIIAGCLFGGKRELVQSILQEYKSVFLKHVTTFEQLISEQEILDILTHDKPVKFYDFNDWDDLQKAFLQILDMYDEVKYDKNKCYREST